MLDGTFSASRQIIFEPIQVAVDIHYNPNQVPTLPENSTIQQINLALTETVTTILGLNIVI